MKKKNKKKTKTQMKKGKRRRITGELLILAHIVSSIDGICLQV